MDVFMGDFAGIVSIELLEDSMQLLVGHELSDVDCSRKEFTIVYLLVTIVVNLSNNLI